jgi:hypothetical protein
MRSWPPGRRMRKGLVDGRLRVRGVVQSLGENREVDGFVGEGDFFDVAELVGEVQETVLPRQLGADLDHARESCRCTRRERARWAMKLGDEALAGAEVGDGRSPARKAQGEVADGLPRAAGTVVFPEACRR